MITDVRDVIDESFKGEKNIINDWVKTTTRFGLKELTVVKAALQLPDISDTSAFFYSSDVYTAIKSGVDKELVNAGYKVVWGSTPDYMTVSLNWGEDHRQDKESGNEH